MQSRAMLDVRTWSSQGVCVLRSLWGLGPIMVQHRDFWVCVSSRQGAFSVFFSDIFDIYKSNQFPSHQPKDLGLKKEE